MTRLLSSWRHKRPARTAALAAASAAVTLGLVLPVTANAGGARPVPAPPASPTSADQIQNIDQVKTAIKAYYGDTLTTRPDPVAGTTMLHEPSATGAYANELAGIETRARHYLRAAAHHRERDGDQKAILLDIDDTSLVTYDYEIYSNFVFNPTTNAAFVNNAVFPATPGMPQLAQRAVSRGYELFFLTGRPIAQVQGTLTNLRNAGYPVVDDHVYLKDLTAPWLASCADDTPACPTSVYKPLTRQHIESLGFNIEANFGDQFSDLSGGFADRTFKLPNPMYFLP